MEITLNVDKYRRIRIYREGGLDLEAFIPGIGWILDNDADIPDHVIDSYVVQARGILDKVKIVTLEYKS